MADAPTLTTLRRAFADICRGYSVARIDGETVYVKHPSHLDHVEYDLIETRYQEEARAMGAEPEKARLEALYAKGEWSDAREQEISRQRGFIDSLTAGRKTIAIPAVLRSHEEQMAREKAKLVEMLNERARALGMTTELYASRRLEDYYLVHNLFRSSDLADQWMTDEAFDNLSDPEVEAIREAYYATIEPCSEANLRRVAVQDFFLAQFGSAADDPSSFWGRPGCLLTYYQVRLTNAARYMRSVMESTDLSKLPAEKQHDPDAIEQAHITQKNLTTAKMEGKLPSGLSGQDIKEAGLEGQYSKVPPENLSGAELVKWLRKNVRPS